MSQQSPAPPRQPGSIWDRKYQDFSRAQHAKAKALGERVAKEPVTLASLGSDLATEVDQMVRDADAMAETRYKELAAERDALEARLSEVLGRESKAVELQAKWKKAMTDKGIKLP